MKDASTLTETPAAEGGVATAAWFTRREWHFSGIAAVCVGVAVVIFWPASKTSHVDKRVPSQRAPLEPTQSVAAPSLDARDVRVDVPAAARRPSIPAAASPLPADATNQLSTPDPAVARLSDQELRRKVVGHWRSDAHGEQEIVIQDDGTASIVLQLDFASSLLYGGRLEMSLKWNVDQGVLTQVITRGTPQENVTQLIRDRGDRVSYLILKLEDQRMELQNVDDPQSLRTWERLP